MALRTVRTAWATVKFETRRFLKRELRARHRSHWVFILFGVVPVALARGIVDANLTMSGIFPAKEERRDADHVYIAFLSDVCPEVTNPNAEAFEKCQATLSLDEGKRSPEWRWLRPLGMVSDLPRWQQN